jgi:ribonuclease-3
VDTLNTRTESDLEVALGYCFSDKVLFKRALTHRSYSCDNYERLEFLGDSVLNCAASILLYNVHPSLDEGKLSRIRSHLVKQDCLAAVGRRIHVDHHLFLGAGELKSSAVIKDSIVADTLEALIGAILLEAGFDKACAVVLRLLDPVLKDSPMDTLGKDPKTQLQEYLQAKRMNLPVYRVLLEGGTASHPEFKVECQVESLGLSHCGVGLSRRVAEQQAAKAILSEIEKKGLL